MSSLETHVESLLADPLADARAAANAGQRVVGYVGSDIPVELILAANALPVRLAGRAGAPTPAADRFVERAFTPDIRSIAEQWLDGSFHCIENVVLSRSDDSAQRLYYYICELQRRGQCDGPTPVIYDVAGIGRDSSGLYTAAATAKLAQELGTSISQLSAAARAVAARAKLLGQVGAQRLDARPPRGSSIHALARASGCAWTTAFDDSLRNLSLPRESFGARVLLAGNVPPDERIHLAFEARGATVVSEFNDAQLLSLASDGAPAESIEAIATRHHGHLSTAQRWLHFADALAHDASEVRADGVLIWMIEEDETLVWGLPAQARALERAGIPTLILTRQSWDVGPESLRRIEQFADDLKEARRERS